MSKDHATTLDIYDAVMIAEGVQDASEEAYYQAWQQLHDTGVAYRLQGWFGRQAQHLIETGHIIG